MKTLRILAVLLLCTLCLAACGEKEPPKEEIVVTEMENGRNLPGYYYQNKLTDSAADPFILEHEGTYYLYSTGSKGYSVRTSKDLLYWQSQSEPIYRLSSTTWAKEKSWAPEMYKYNDKFYLVYSAKGHNGLHSVDIAVCDTPNGTFKPLNREKPFYGPNFSVIDASLFFDDDGRIYLYYSKDNSTNYVDGKRTSQTWGVEVKPDFSGTIGEHVLISTPVQGWELKSGSVVWNEGPVVFKQNGTYYLLYSANYYVSEHYSIGYAYSDSPLKMFEKASNAKLVSGNGTTVTGPGHCNILRSPDGTEMYVVYHVHTVPPNTDHGRSLAIDRLVVMEDGSLKIDGPSETRRLLPSGINGYFHVKDYTYTGAGEKAEIPSLSNIKNVFDGVSKGGLEGIYSMDEGGTVDITLDTPTALTAIWIHPSTLEDYKPGSVDVLVNGQYLYKELTFTGRPDNPLVVVLSELPEGTAVETVKVTVHLGEGKTYAALSEISMVTARQK